MTPRRAAVLLLAMLALTGCTRAGNDGTLPSTTAAVSPTPTPTPPPSTTASTASPTSTASSATAPTTAGTPAAGASPSEAHADPRWRFYSADKAWHTSPWFAGRHQVMIGYGCNASPWYPHDPRCPGHEGFHHGIDVAMPCGTPLRSAVDGVVLDPSAPGSPGTAYGVHPFRIRTGDHDILIGHTVTVFVHPGDHVRPGEQIALAGDSGAPDGCHLHFEVRRAGGGLSTAVDPSRWLRLS